MNYSAVPTEKPMINRTIHEYIYLGIAVLLASVGLKAFLLPNGFLDGGVTGVAILVSSIYHTDISIILVLVSVPFLILCWFTLRRKIFYKSIVCILSLALAIYFENFPKVTDDKLLIAIFGGIFLGSGIGLAIKNGAVLDGSEILGIYFFEKFGIKVGQTVLIFNTLLFGITAIVASLESAMYSLLTFIVTSRVIDMFIKGFEDYIGIMIVSDQHNKIKTEIANTINSKIIDHRNVNSGDENSNNHSPKLIQTIVKRIDIRKIQNKIHQIDPDAMVAEFDINDVKNINRKLTLR